MINCLPSHRHLLSSPAIVQFTLPLTLEKGPFNSVHIKPAWNEDQHTMDGGNYAATCDSRFNSAIKELIGHHFYGAVAIHDRVEDY